MSTAHPPKRRRTNDRDGSPQHVSSLKATIRASTPPPTTTQPERITHITNNPVPISDEEQQVEVVEHEDWTSSSGSDSGSDNDSNEDDVNRNRNPTTITAHPTLPTNPTIHTRLTSFFSSLAEQRANPSTTQQPGKIEIDSGSDSGFEDDDEDGGQRGQYIELDLALGVLSEKGSDDDEDVGRGEIKVPGLGGEDEDSESGSENEDESESETGGLAELTNVAAGVDAGPSRRRRRKTRKQEQKRKIEEVG